MADSSTYSPHHAQLHPITSDNLQMVLSRLYETGSSSSGKRTESDSLQILTKNKTECLEKILGVKETAIYYLRKGTAKKRAIRQAQTQLAQTFPEASTVDELAHQLSVRLDGMLKESRNGVLPGLYYGYYRRPAGLTQQEKIVRFVLTLCFRATGLNSRKNPDQLAHLLSPSTFKIGKWQLIYGDLYVYLRSIKSDHGIPYDELIIIPGIKSKIKNSNSIDNLIGISLWSSEEDDPMCSNFHLEKKNSLPSDLFDSMNMNAVESYPFGKVHKEAVETFFALNTKYDQSIKIKIMEFLLSGPTPPKIEEYYQVHQHTSLTVSNKHQTGD